MVDCFRSRPTATVTPHPESIILLLSVSDYELRSVSILHVWDVLRLHFQRTSSTISVYNHEMLVSDYEAHVSNYAM